MLHAWISDAPCLVAALIISFVLLRRRTAELESWLFRLKSWAGHPVLVCLFTALFPVFLRLALLPWSPIPHPVVHDEFSHLLVADTLVSGRLANPTHPFWRHFETIYVLQRPTYSSIYPLGQGALLALGKVVLGHPWLGVLASIALMNAALFWMLRALLPRTWAAVGCVVAALQFGIFGYWINSYWGGAFTAAAGALFFGALIRFVESPRLRWGLMAGVVGIVLWHTRPFETIGLVAGAVTLTCWRFTRYGARRQFPRLFSFLLPVGFCVVLTISFTAYHNYRVTGDAWTLPYRQSQKQYGVPTGLLWEKETKEPRFFFQDIEDCYRWQKEQRRQVSGFWGFWREQKRRLFVLWLLYVSPALTFPLIAVFAAGSKLRFPVLRFLILALCTSAPFPFFYPHYLAGYTCLILVFIIAGLRALWDSGNRVKRVLALGSVVALGIVAVAQVSFLFRSAAELRGPHDTQWSIAQQLRKRPGRHLVLVRYSPKHDFHREWVYNEANIDGSQVVWAREIDAESDKKLFEYFRDRTFWVLEPDVRQLRLTPYSSSYPVTRLQRNRVTE